MMMQKLCAEDVLRGCSGSHVLLLLEETF